MILLLLQLIYIAIGLFWLTIFCFKESVVSVTANHSATPEQFFQTEAGRVFTQIRIDSTINFAANSVTYSRYQIWGLIPAMLSTTLFATIVCGYVDQFEPGWLQSWYIQLIFISGGLGLLTSAILAAAERFLAIKIFFAYLLIICVVVQMNIIHLLWLW